MLKKHLKKAAALLVSIATIPGTLPTMAASNEEEMIEEQQFLIMRRKNFRPMRLWIC